MVHLRTHVVISNTQLHRRFQWGGSPLPLLSELGVGCTPPLDFYITLKAFELEQVIYDHRQGLSYILPSHNLPVQFCLDNILPW